MRSPRNLHHQAHNGPQQPPELPLGGHQLEIFPLHPGTNPARPEGDSRRPNSSRSLLATIGSGHSSGSQPQSTKISTDRNFDSNGVARAVSRWKVARDAWQAVERIRAKRDGVATVLRQGTVAAITDGDMEVDRDRLTMVERVLALTGFVLSVALLLLAA